MTEPVAGSAETVDPVDLYVRAVAAFGEQVQAIGAEEWDLHTPCSEWDIRALVAHVVLGESQVPDLVAGTSVAAAEVDVSVLGREPMAAWRGTALRAIETARATPPDTVVQHPVGAVPFRTVLGFRITDNLVHAWDLATSRGQAFDFDEEIAEWCLAFWLPMAEQLSSSSFFAPMLEPPDQEPGSRLLALLGRSA